MYGNLDKALRKCSFIFFLLVFSLQLQDQQGLSWVDNALYSDRLVVG